MQQNLEMRLEQLIGAWKTYYENMHWLVRVNCCIKNDLSTPKNDMYWEFSGDVDAGSVYSFGPCAVLDKLVLLGEDLAIAGGSSEFGILFNEVYTFWRFRTQTMPGCRIFG